ncbi:hypothetical protein [Paracoccus sp. (in: a-proteobacteria)]|uniref:hypothetical protein n=1 Tax=Paracoccus sp. TaxID=267 RepID=UPI0026DF1EB3|nr:hypothetical protein [Paracoccus sp. (in: a-proteobacteria)]MDO5648198.1 hypothetical protein [Paracoccus sp. (in: a-proteobacteria)]
MDTQYWVIHMYDVLLLAGVALSLLSVVLAVVQLMQTRPPRMAAITLVLGLVLILASAWDRPAEHPITDLAGAWSRVTQ